MSFSTLTRRNAYTGDGTTTVFPYTFKIFAPTYLRVVRRTLIAGVATEVTAVNGTDYTVSGVGISSGGNVTFTTAPLNGDVVVILGAQPLSQDMSIRNQDAYFPATIEDGADQSRMIDQQLQEVLQRAVKVPATTPSSFNPHMPLLSSADAYKLLRIKGDFSGFEVVSGQQALAGGGNSVSGKLNAPTDGTYGGPSGNPAKVAIGDLYEDAFDKVATLLGKMVPPPPNNLSAMTLALTSSYTALAAGSGASHTVTDNTSPTVTPGLAATFANSFADSDNGTLSATVDSVQAGLITLTTGDDSGTTNGSLTIISEFDPYAGQSGKAGLYKAMTAKVVPTGLNVGLHTVVLIHSLTGQTSVAFYVDDPGSPTLSNLQIQPSGTTAYKSGVPYYAAGATMAVRFAAAGAVQSHYSTGPVVTITTNVSSGTVQKSPASAPAAYSTYSDNGQATVVGGVYTEAVQASVTAYNSKQVASAPSTVSSSIRVDTIGTEARVTSGTGQFPTSGYGQAYDSTLSLASNKALQYLAGAYRYPPAVSYAASLPAGPDYSALTPDTYNNMRWVTFQFGTVSSATSVSFTLQSASGFTATLQSGFALYVRVDGATPTAGWVDGNAAYSGTGSPTNNGDGALDVSQSTTTFKRITFGSTVRTGTVFVRIGIPQGSSLFFGGIA